MRASTFATTVRRFVALTLAPTVLVLAMAGPTVARTSVDPNTLNPAPPDFFNAQCYAGAAGTICDLAFADPANPIVDEPSGIICGGTEILFSQNRFVVGKRFYDADGNLTRRHFREYMAGDLTDPETGNKVYWDQHDTVLHDLSIPGDLDSGTIRFTGLISRFVTSSGRTLLVDSGTTLVDSSTGEVVQAGRNHPLDDYFSGRDSGALQSICAALDA
jgi:hypothetical protein